jgi:bis(5'-nucleosidyl)-tetraphosphatase
MILLQLSTIHAMGSLRMSFSGIIRVRVQRMKDQSFGVIPIRRHVNDYQFLLVQHHAGHWAFPKGHAENNETDDEAARRELHEETGVANATLIPGIVLNETYYFKHNHQTITKSVRYFIGLVMVSKVHIQVAEIKAYTWAGFDKALGMITFSESRRILTEAHNYIEAHSPQINKLLE